MVNKLLKHLGSTESQLPWVTQWVCATENSLLVNWLTKFYLRKLNFVLIHGGELESSVSKIIIKLFVFALKKLFVRVIYVRVKFFEIIINRKLYFALDICFC